MPIIQVNTVGSHFVVIPASVVRMKGFKNGDKFLYTERRQVIAYVRGEGRKALKLHCNGSKGSHWIVIPIDIVERKRWKKGTELVIGDRPNGFVLTRGEER